MRAEHFDQFEISQLPLKEDHLFEFKSSQIGLDKLANEMCMALSGFGNAGGGYIVAGINDDGVIDGGIPKLKGKTPIRDWLDQKIQGMESSPRYFIRTFDDPAGRGTLKQDHVLIVVFVPESPVAPHMAPDGCYYLRAGAHTVPAPQIVVEALWAKRRVSNPKLGHLFRHKPDNQHVIQLGIVSISPEPAIDVRIHFSCTDSLAESPKFLREFGSTFPIQVPLIDRSNPLYFDVSLSYKLPEDFGTRVQVHLEYRDLAGRMFEETIVLRPQQSMPDAYFTDGNFEKIVGALEAIQRTFQAIDKRMSLQAQPLPVAKADQRNDRAPTETRSLPLPESQPDVRSPVDDDRVGIAPESHP